MKTIAVTKDFEASLPLLDQTLAGEVFHVTRPSAGGGAILTPIARYYCYRLEFIENFNKHWRIDCYLRDHPLAPDHRFLGERLAEALVREGLITEPVWMSAFRSSGECGRAYGEVCSDD